jgi:hypothetical protein
MDCSIARHAGQPAITSLSARCLIKNVGLAGNYGTSGTHALPKTATNPSFSANREVMPFKAIPLMPTLEIS